jgi:hypothetical protein
MNDSDEPLEPINVDALASRSAEWRKAPFFPPERPPGIMAVVTISIILAFVLAICFLLVWANVRPGGAYSRISIAGNDIEIESPTGLLVYLAAYAVFNLAVAIGLWALKSWARAMAIFGHGLNLLIFFVSNFVFSVTGGTLANVLVSMGIIIYLSIPSVKEGFVI